MTSNQPEHYIGLISGTSADGVDAVVVCVGVEKNTPIQTLSALAVPYPDELKQRVLQTTRAQANILLDDLGALDHDIALVFAKAANAAIHAAGLSSEDIVAIGSHGQTLRHRPNITSRFTMQAGDPSLIAEHTGCTVVADLRRRDMAAGGEGAPLAPIIHQALWASSAQSSPKKQTTAVLNLGGIANITLLNNNGDVLAWDTGPASCLMDAWCLQHQGNAYDKDGAWAATGSIHHPLLNALLADSYMQRLPPKSTGREYFNMTWLNSFDEVSNLPPADVQCTLLAFSAQSIANQLNQHEHPIDQLIVCGGGVHNTELMNALAQRCTVSEVLSSAALGVDPDYVEATAFAWMARQTMHHLPSNIPSVTGAKGGRVLGGIYLK